MKKKYNYSLIFGICITSIIVLMTIIGKFWTPYDPNELTVTLKSKAPGMEHLMGTDNLGRDIFSRVMVGTGTTLYIALCTVFAGGFFGTIIGALTGYFGGWIDEIVMRINDIILSFPSILLALIFVSVLGSGQSNIILALSILFIPSFARIVRSEIIRLKTLDFIVNAKVMGAGHLRIIFVHLMPNIVVSMLTTAAIGFNNAILAEASMSYLGIGVQLPDASLGRIISQSQAYLFDAPWFAIFPGIVIILTILGFNLMSEGLRIRST